MNNFHSFHNNSYTDWQLLGELTLRLGANIEEPLQAWLSEVLGPLKLNSLLLNRIMSAAKHAAGRALRSGRVEEFDHLHLLVHVPRQATSRGQTWGFFQIEKLGDSDETRRSGDHAVEFYLYLEG